MSLSKKAKEAIRRAVTSDKAAAELQSAIESGANQQSAHVANVTTADATDLASAEALANANKAKINELLAALQAAGLMA